jgi:cytidylate kinase
MLRAVSGASSPIIIAIDGPGASGKSTTARALAARLGFLYVDTGAMYRTLAWHCLAGGVAVDDAKAVATVCRRWKTALKEVDGAVKLAVNGEMPVDAIRTQRVTEAASKVAAMPAVRKWMKLTQRKAAAFGNIVVEGRDIGTNVFPETDLKFFLDAPGEVRAERRRGQGLREDLEMRDRRDSQRGSSPLMIPLGAVLIQNGTLTPEQTLERILSEISRRHPHLRALVDGAAAALG